MPNKNGETNFQLNLTVKKVGNAIHILSNDDFSKENGVIRGKGTESEPYIIKMTDVEQIYIKDTTDHFIIQNCKLTGLWLDSSAIYFKNVKNGIIQDCIIKEVPEILLGASVILNSCSNTKIKNCYFYGNGIDIDQSNYNEIDGCKFYGRLKISWGIRIMYNSDNNVVHHCDIWDHMIGIETYKEDAGSSEYHESGPHHQGRRCRVAAPSDGRRRSRIDGLQY